MLAWLTGRDDQTGQPSPLQYDDGPSLRTYNPPPSEQFSSWLAGLLGAGPGASLAHQNFAEGVPKVLMATPLGIGMSALDFAHAKAANDPIGAAAAAIGMIPAAGPEVRAGMEGAAPAAKKALGEYGQWLEKQLALPNWTQSAAKTLLPWQDETDKALQTISHVMKGRPAPEFQPNPTGYEGLKGIEPKSAIHEALDADNFKEAIVKIQDALNAPTNIKSRAFDYEKDDNGLYHIFDAVSGKTLAVKDTESQVKAWINAQKAAGMGLKPIPITENGKATSSPYTPIRSSPSETIFGDLGEFPSAVPFKPPEQALASGYVTPAVHGTKLGKAIWALPSKSGIGESGDALRLPSTELGVHFGTPDQAQHFTGRTLDPFYQPRTYPTVLKTGKSLELPDSGTWHMDDIKDSLRRLNQGNGYGVDSGSYKVTNPKAHVGEFPEEEHAGINSIEGIRDYLSRKGYDSVNYINKVEGKGQRSYIMFKPSPEAPKFVAGVRSPFAAFNPSQMMRPELGLGIAGLLGAGAALSPSESKAASPRGPHINDVLDTINATFPSTMPLPLQGQRP